MPGWVWCKAVCIEEEGMCVISHFATTLYLHLWWSCLKFPPISLVWTQNCVFVGKSNSKLSALASYPKKILKMKETLRSCSKASHSIQLLWFGAYKEAKSRNFLVFMTVANNWMVGLFDFFKSDDFPKKQWQNCQNDVVVVLVVLSIKGSERDGSFSSKLVNNVSVVIWKLYIADIVRWRLRYVLVTFQDLNTKLSTEERPIQQNWLISKLSFLFAEVLKLHWLHGKHPGLTQPLIPTQARVLSNRIPRPTDG